MLTPAGLSSIGERGGNFIRVILQAVLNRSAIILNSYQIQVSHKILDRRGYLVLTASSGHQNVLLPGYDSLAVRKQFAAHRTGYMLFHSPSSQFESNRTASAEAAELNSIKFTVVVPGDL